MKVSTSIIGDLNAIAVAEVKSAEQSVTAGVSRAGQGLQKELRQQLVGAGLGRRLSNAIRFNVYPDNRPSVNAAAFVFARPGKGGRGGAADIIAAYEEGALIRANGGKYLAIPTANVPIARRGRKMTPAQVQDSARRGGFGRDLELVPTNRPGVLLLVLPAVRAKNGKGFRPASPRRLAAGREQEWVVMFILIRQAKLAKRLDWRGPAEEWANRLPDLIVQEMETRDRG